jgi:hypothetical protein
MSTPNFSDRLIYTVPSGSDDREELLAMREWRICEQFPPGLAFLTSLNGEQVWLGPVFESPWSPDEPPGPSAGVHGLKRWPRRQLWREGWFYGRETWAWGWVALSGLVEETPAGYRAQVAVIRQLRLGPRTLALFPSREALRDLIGDLEQRYQCRVKIGYPEWRTSRTMVPAR